MLYGCRASVIVNNYNYGRFLREAVESALSQTYQNAEVIVVDDGSTDQSREIIAGYGDRLVAVMKPNGGQTSAFNEGFRRSLGEAVVFLDADDALFPAALEKAVQLFSGENVAKVHWPLVEIDELSAETGKVRCENPSHGDFKDLMLREGPGSYLSPPTSGNAWSRRFLEKVFPLPEAPDAHTKGATSPDAYLSALAPLFGPVRCIREAQGYYRLHGNNAYVTRALDQRIAHDWTIFEHCSEALRRYGEELGMEVHSELWGMNSWLYRLRQSVDDITRLVPENKSFILVDEEQWEAGQSIAGRKRIPFLERDGQYWGVPSDDDIAIRELERLRHKGASFLIFAWPAFWWLDYFSGMHRYLRTQFRCVMENGNLLMFNLEREQTSA